MINRFMILLLLAVMLTTGISAQNIASPTEGVITSEFVPEAQMKADMLQMLADFAQYMTDDFQECVEPNSKNELCGCFRGENTMGSNEQGVRPNADLSMICAFLVKYGKPANVRLPQGVTWQRIEEMAMRSLVFAYSTHKANRLKVCAGNRYWGSVSAKDNSWESSLWAMSVAYSAFFQWDKLTAEQRGYIYALLKAECNYELERDIPTGYKGDTKAEENGWEVDILAATLGLFPDDELAPRWFQRMRVFAINSYSHESDAKDNTVIDPDYDRTTVANLYKGANLYADYTLQNHNYFHTSYQNVVMQELGEAALALKMFQKGVKGEERWKSNALMHHNQDVQDKVLNWLALADGELAMPNGNDWSLFLYDQITSYSTQACFQRDANALMLENLAYKYIKARQKTTKDGSWLLRADVGARRMGVEAHRVMMSYLMHDVLSTADMTPTSWDDFNRTYSAAKRIDSQNIVRASSDSRFVTFSWSEGLKSYTGYIAANSPDKNKIIVPFRANNTGNFLGWYEVEGRKTNAVPVVSNVCQLKDNSFIINGELNTNEASLNQRFAIYATPGNAVMYLDYVTALKPSTITAEKGGLMAISVDEMTKTSRTLYYHDDGADVVDGSKLTVLPPLTFNGEVIPGIRRVRYPRYWVNIDDEVGFSAINEHKTVAFGDRKNNNSIMTAKLYSIYSDSLRSVQPGDVVDARNMVYYSKIHHNLTESVTERLRTLRPTLPQGWNGIIAADRDIPYIMVSNFCGETTEAFVSELQYEGYAPVLSVPTYIKDNMSMATISLTQNSTFADPIHAIIKGNDIMAKCIDDETIVVTANKGGMINVVFAGNAEKEASSGTVILKKGDTVRVFVGRNGHVNAESSIPRVSERNRAPFTRFVEKIRRNW